MTARRLSVLSLPFFLVACAATSLAHAQESGDEAVLGPAVAPGGGSPYDGRFAASNYRFDSGTSLTAYGSLAANYDAVWVTRFDAAGGADAITSVTTPFAYTAVGTTATIYIWEDPNEDGDPSDKVLIATVPVEVQSQCFCATPSFNVFPLPQPVPVRGSFFVGVKVPGKNGEYPALFEASTPYAPNRSFGRMITAGFDPVTTPLNPYGTAASPVTWFIRANGSNSGFTYQGSLNVSGAAYTGNADLIATIYDAESGGAAMSPSFAIAGVSVTNGLFSVRIPADASSFDPGADRWLELGVKRATETGYTTLVPRHRITSVPTALAAARVDWSGLTNIPATLPPWNQVSGGIAYTAGRVGIGTSNPIDQLSLLGGAMSFAPASNPVPFVGLDYDSATDALRFRTNVGASALNGTAMTIKRTSGDVGIGTTSPSARLHVLGTARFVGPNNGGVITTTDFGLFGGTQLLATLTGNNAGAQVRLATSTSAANFIDVGQNSSGDFVVEGNDNPRLTVTNTGNVGIGNPTPATLLHVGNYSTGPNTLRIAAAGTRTQSVQFRFFSDLYGWNIDSVDDNSVNPSGLYFRSAFGSATFTDRMFISVNSGNVGIGTTNAPHRLTVSGNVSANNVVVPSSIRFKDHVTPLAGALDGLLKLDGVRFDWKPEYAATRPGREHDLGFVAEDVEKVFPELVFRDADGNVTGMDYSRLTAVAVAAIKEQQTRFDADKAAKQREIDDLKARLERLESQFNARSNAK